MIRILPSQVTPQVRVLFDSGMPASLRCFAVLDGNAAGQIWVDTSPSPDWGVVREAAFGSLYFGGAPDAATICAMIANLKNQGDVLIGLWPEDDLWQVLPPDPDYVGSVLDFDIRLLGDSSSSLLAPIPEGCQLRHLDGDLFQTSMMASYLTSVYGSIEEALEQGIGLCLVRDEATLSESSAGPCANGLIEIGVETRKQHQRCGYATLVCAHLIKECEGLGFGTYWNCNAQNSASIALAHKLGYQPAREYRLAAWS